MSQVTINEAQSKLSHLIRQALSGEEVVITKGKKPLVKLVPIAEKQAERKIGTDKGMVEIADDFDAPLDDFKEYMP